MTKASSKLPTPGADGNLLELTADRDGTFELRNARTGFVEHYPAH